MTKVLVVDDSKLICSIIVDILKKNSFDVFFVHSGKQAMKTACSEMPDLILLDLMLPDINGYEVCRFLKANPVTSEIPIIFITASNDEKSIIKGFDVGCVDYVCKPFSAVELVARVQAHVKNKKMADLLRATNEQLTQMLNEKREWAVRDSMTGLYNRYFFMEQLPHWEALLASNIPLCLILADVDDFKKVNDYYGHSAGDYVLRTVADLMKAHTEENVSVIRWGGEEFLLVLPHKTLTEAGAVAELIRSGMEAFSFIYKAFSFFCTITMGVVQIDKELTVDKNLDKVDIALYEGKRIGKNCISIKT